MGCPSGKTGTRATNFHIVIAPLPPQDLDPGSNPQQLAEFAWAVFFALNWQLSFAKSHKRDMPDATLAVREIYAHCIELRLNSLTLQPFDSLLRYQYSFAKMPTPGAKFNRFNNLDENNEIGSCNLYGQARQQDSNQMVLYQVKVNRAEYEYISHTFGGDTTKLYAAGKATARSIARYHAYAKGAKKPLRLPARRQRAVAALRRLEQKPAGHDGNQNRLAQANARRRRVEVLHP
jgi:hypothetical protein